MIFLSILAKSFALALMHHHPRLAAGCWLVGAVADVRVAKNSSDAPGISKVLKSLVQLQISSLLIGWAVANVCDYAAMRWKDGIPVFASMIDGLLRLIGVSAGSDRGQIFLTEMAGSLKFFASIDVMALKLPVVFLSISAVWLLWTESAIRVVLRKLGIIAGILLALALIRTCAMILLAAGLCDFVGYESEELPYRPFMDESGGIFLYLPFLLAAGVLIGRIFSPPAVPRDTCNLAGGQASSLSRPTDRLEALSSIIAIPVLFLLSLAIFWQPSGTAKNGKLVISSYHSQWSRSDRPYDREWYGADSGYNYACFKRLFEKFYQVSDATGPLTEADLEGASTLVIYDPDRRFSKDEIERVQEFVRKGGGLLMIGDHTNVFGSTSHLNEVCGPFGFQFRDDVLFDLDEDFHQMIDAPKWASSFWHGMSFFKLRGPASIRPTSLWTRCVYQVGHSKSVRAIYSVNNFYPPPHDNPKMKSGTFCVSAASHYGKGRVAAWGDSTVFSNFEIFYPGKQEYLLNTMAWLNHQDGMLPAMGRRMALMVLLAGVVAFLLWRREPKVWLATLAGLVVVLAAARMVCGVLELRRATFPTPKQASDWVIFAADPKDPGHHLRGFMSEEPYNERYEVFIQWVMRTGAFTGFHLLKTERANGLYEHLRTSEKTKVVNALIVRKPSDLGQLDDFAKIPRRANDPLLLMFASSVPINDVLAAIDRAGIAKNESLEKIRKAWPNGEVLIDDDGRRLMVIAGAERFSDQAMGISEKVVPDEPQKVLFKQTFSMIDQLLGRASE